MQYPTEESQAEAAGVVKGPVGHNRFVREVLLPGGYRAIAKVDDRFTRFLLKAGPSPIDRWGLFAAEAIPRGRVVIEFTGERITQEQSEFRELRQRDYLFELDSDCVIDGIMGGSGGEFVNHGCEPNLRFRVLRRRVFLVSLRPIAQGEELTLNYNISPESELSACNCGADGCKGVMNPERPPSPELPNRRSQTSS